MRLNVRFAVLDNTIHLNGIFSFLSIPNEVEVWFYDDL